MGRVLKPLWVGEWSCTEPTVGGCWVMCRSHCGWELGHVPKPLWVGAGSCTEATVGG